MLTQPLLERAQRILLMLALLAFTAAGTATAAEYYLWADQGSLSLPDGRSVPVWGFGLDGDGDFSTADYTISVPGPRLTVGPGETALIVHLMNNLPEPVSLHILGQHLTNNNGPVWTAGLSQTVAATKARPAGDFTARVRSFSHETPPGKKSVYKWLQFRPGTYLLQSGTNPAKQVPMGLYAAVTRDAAPGFAYTGVPYDRELLFLIHDVDPHMNEAIAAGDYGPGKTVTSSALRVPRYFLINGVSYPSLDLRPIVHANAGERLLIRFLNAGLEIYTPQIYGAYMTVWAEEGNRYLYPKERYGFELAPGKIVDAVFQPPLKGWYPLYDASLNLTNAGSAQLGGIFSYVAYGTGE